MDIGELGTFGVPGILDYGRAFVVHGQLNLEQRVSL